MLVAKRKHSGFPSIFDDFFRNDFYGGGIPEVRSGRYLNGDAVPAVNVLETENGFELELALPGVKKDEINLELNERVLTISSKHKEEKVEKNDEENYTRKEFSYTSFSRSFTLPKDVSSEKIEANFEDGVLKVNIPRETEVQKIIKKISIS